MIGIEKEKNRKVDFLYNLRGRERREKLMLIKHPTGSAIPKFQHIIRYCIIETCTIYSNYYFGIYLLTLNIIPIIKTKQCS